MQFLHREIQLKENLKVCEILWENPIAIVNREIIQKSKW